MEAIDYAQYAIVFLVGLLCGGINTLAGGGSLITIPLLIFFMGLPSVTANGTNRLAVFSQSLWAMRGFKSKGLKLPQPYVFYLSLAALIGGLIGVQMALVVNDEAFKQILSGVMIVSLFFVLLNKKNVEQPKSIKIYKQVIGIFIFFGIGIYGGFVQAGVGFLIITVLSKLHHFKWSTINYIKVFTAILYTGVSIIFFIIEGHVMWAMGITLAIGQGLGGWYASRWSVEKGEKWAKIILTVTIIPMIIKFWFF